MERVLTDQASVQNFWPDTNTVFTCGVHDIDPVMTYMFRVYDMSGNLADCWLFGTDPQGDADVQSGNVPMHNTVSSPQDIAGCATL